MSSNIAITGLNAITSQLDTISDNIANSGTVGYKSGRTEFAALYQEGNGMGVGVTGVTQSMATNGSIVSSDRSFDTAINGNGFFVCRDSNGDTSSTFYSRVGYLQTDDNGNLVNDQGMYIQGHPVDASGNIQSGVVADITLSSGSLPAKSTSNVDFVANFNANDTVPTTTTFDPDDSTSYNNTYSTQVYDSLGREHTLSQYFVKTGDNTWDVNYCLDSQPISGSNPTSVTFSNQGVLASPTTPVVLNVPVQGAQALSLNMDYTGTTQYGASFAVGKNSGDGYASGDRTGQSIDSDGSIYATFSNGQRLLQGQIILANFTNPNGLEATDGTTWSETIDSGQPLIGEPSSSQFGSLKSSALESSNVDLTSELVGLMTAQRNYQANTKVISTDDNMMNALFQAV